MPPRKPLRLAFTTFPTYRQKLLCDIYNSTRCVMSFNPAKLVLVPHEWCVIMGPYEMLTLHCFHRPVKEGVRVTPEELRQYRDTHQYLGPGCLCPLLEPISEERVFREAAIYLSALGRYKGEWVAECAMSRCGYLGSSSQPFPHGAGAHTSHYSVPLERIYPKNGVPLKVFPLRGQSLN